MFPFASEAFAMPGGGDGGGGAMLQFLPFVLIFLIFWFLIIRPQQKKAKAHRELMGNLRKGDEVKTDGGIHGTITRMADDFVTLEISHKVPIRIDRGRIVERTSSKRELPPKHGDEESDED